eukprot:TRINITY_DN75162_c0_g1_i1.p1 TRINITY_DN75162_c0_g1~~TRINITY_DN75162_c0_g1_i1.p1  ORF type:complete len:133 (+),score=21.86 TRINITY_DN75162_c0_g1_i1:64-462(+)
MFSRLFGGATRSDADNIDMGLLAHNLAFVADFHFEQPAPVPGLGLGRRARPMRKSATTDDNGTPSLAPPAPGAAAAAPAAQSITFERCLQASALGASERRACDELRVATMGRAPPSSSPAVDRRPEMFGNPR